MNVKRIESTDENVSKYVFDFGNAVAESVLYKYPTYEERTVICCSTQSGCPVGCRFCGAGDAFVRSLTADEIVGQVQYLFADRGIDTDKVQRCQIMFMSMGEPLLNFNALADAIEALESQLKNASVSAIAEAAEVDRMKAEVERLTTLAHGQHIELYNARLQLAAAQGQEPVGTIHEDGYWVRANNPTGNAISDAMSIRKMNRLTVYAAPIPQQVAEPAPSSLPLLSEAFRTTESNGASSDYRMVFKFKDLASLHSADDEWRKFKGAA